MIKGNLPRGCSTGGLKRFKLPLEAGLMKGVCAGVTEPDEDGTHLFRVGPLRVHPPTGRGLGKVSSLCFTFRYWPRCWGKSLGLVRSEAAPGQVVRILLPRATWHYLGPQTSRISGPVVKRTKRAPCGSCRMLESSAHLACNLSDTVLANRSLSLVSIFSYIPLLFI